MNNWRSLSVCICRQNANSFARWPWKSNKQTTFYEPSDITTINHLNRSRSKVAFDRELDTRVRVKLENLILCQPATQSLSNDQTVSVQLMICRLIFSAFIISFMKSKQRTTKINTNSKEKGNDKHLQAQHWRRQMLENKQIETTKWNVKTCDNSITIQSQQIECTQPHSIASEHTNA